VPEQALTSLAQLEWSKGFVLHIQVCNDLKRRSYRSLQAELYESLAERPAIARMMSTISRDR
jgi:hypothetical protein